MKTRPAVKILTAMLIGLGAVVVASGGAVLARAGIELQPARDGLLPASAGDKPILPLTYAYVITDNVPVYSDPAQAMLGIPPVRSLGSGYLWVSLADIEPVSRNGEQWYRINDSEYVRGSSLAIYKPSAFRGVTLANNPEHPLAWLVYSVRASSAPGETPAKDAPLLTRYTQVTIFEEQQVGDWMWYRVGESQWIEQRKVGLVRVSPRPEGVGPTDKWIDVNLFEQTLAAYEGDRLMYATLVSTGLPQWKTETGLFRIWVKVKLAKMSGREGFADYYYLEDVPWTMYFNGSFALHTAYWHDRFGFPHSHGCVNLTPADAQWLFDWTAPATGRTNWTMAAADDPGTWVWVHDR